MKKGPSKLESPIFFTQKLLANCYNANLIENEEKHVDCVNCKESETLPLLELALDDCWDNSYSASSNAYWEVEYQVNSVYWKCCAVDYGAKRQDQSSVDDVSADDVTNREGGLLLADSSECSYKLRKGCAQCDNCETDDCLADTNACSNCLSCGNKTLSTKNNGSCTDNK